MSEGKSVNDQFQIGDVVVYVPEGIVTQVRGYLWIDQMGELPVVGLYELSCGIHAPAGALRMAGEDDLRRIDPEYWAAKDSIAAGARRTKHRFSV